MTPAARYAAACQVLDHIEAGHPAERALLGWARGARYAGSKDRAAVRDIVFSVLRSWNSCAVLGGGTDGRARILGVVRLTGMDPSGVFTGAGYGLAPLTATEAAQCSKPLTPVADVPQWLLPEITRSLGPDASTYLEALRQRAPIWLRVNAARTTPEAAQAALAREGIAVTPHPDIKGCLQATDANPKIHLSQSFSQGLVDLQDAASQAMVAALPLKASDRVLDYCAGGGGKSLALAARGAARTEAHDVNPARMADIPERAKRLGVQVACVTQPSPPYELVVCDAPCSGSGAWRRSPDGKWALTQDRLAELMATQDNILRKAALMVAQGGVLAYATCSVLRCENEDTVDRFLTGHPDWVCNVQKRWPMNECGDGFFVAVFARE